MGLRSEGRARAPHRRSREDRRVGAALPVTPMRLLEHRPRQRDCARLAGGKTQARRRHGAGGVGNVVRRALLAAGAALALRTVEPGKARAHGQ